MKGIRRFNLELVLTLIRLVRLWAGMSPGRIWALARRLALFHGAARRRDRYLRVDGITVPPSIIFSATMRCNLECCGCYSRNYSLKNELTAERMDRLFSEAASLGVSLFVITGGEPFLRDGLLDIVLRHRDLVFLLFNNGTRLDAGAAKRIGRADNIVPLLSIDGDEEMTDSRRGKGVYRTALGAMELLQKERSFFGFSVMVSNKNIDLVQKDSFHDDLIRRGCRIGLLVSYVPACGDSPLDLLPSVESRRALRSRVRRLQRNKQLILMQMPDDEYELMGGCLAAGKGFVHINAHGYVEPCPFFHRSTHTVRDSSLRDALGSKWLRFIRTETNFTEIPHQGCALFEHRHELAQAADSIGVLDTESVNK